MKRGARVFIFFLFFLIYFSSLLRDGVREKERSEGEETCIEAKK
jgi:hypothetical protein